MDHSPEVLRGELTRWLLEVKAGVFVGTVSAIVRNLLWEKIENEVDTGAEIMIYPAQNEQGFEMQMCHSPRRQIIDIKGLCFIKMIMKND